MNDIYVTLHRSEAQEGGGDETTRTIGPFEYVELTYERLSCDTDKAVFFLSSDTGFWHEEKRVPISGAEPWVACGPDEDKLGYTDFTIHTKAPS